MKVGAIIQARMGSTRLPGKVLKDIAGESMLARVVKRVLRASGLDEVIVATTELAEDEAIVRECRYLEVPWFRGSSEDVLDRFLQAALAFHLDVVIRITSDCPLIDSSIIERVLQAFWFEEADYASNTLRRTYPRGLDTEILTTSALHQAWAEADQNYQREHVTPYIYESPDRFRLVSVENDADAGGDLAAQRWTVDTVEDLEFIREVYRRVPSPWTSWREIYDIVKAEPLLATINGHIQQKALKESG